jgi:hypothetical protein
MKLQESHSNVFILAKLAHLTSAIQAEAQALILAPSFASAAQLQTSSLIAAI